MSWTLQPCKENISEFSSSNESHEVPETLKIQSPVCTKYVIRISTSMKLFQSLSVNKPISVLHSHRLESCNSSTWWPVLVAAGSPPWRHPAVLKWLYLMLYFCYTFSPYSHNKGLGLNINWNSVHYDQPWWTHWTPAGFLRATFGSCSDVLKLLSGSGTILSVLKLFIWNSDIISCYLSSYN